MGVVAGEPLHRVADHPVPGLPHVGDEDVPELEIGPDPCRHLLDGGVPDGGATTRTSADRDQTFGLENPQGLAHHAPRYRQLLHQVVFDGKGSLACSSPVMICRRRSAARTIDAFRGRPLSPLPHGETTGQPVTHPVRDSSGRGLPLKIPTTRSWTAPRAALHFGATEAYTAQLACLRDEPPRAVPDLRLLVEPAWRRRPERGRSPGAIRQPGRRGRNWRAGRLGPSLTTDLENRRWQGIDAEEEKEGVGRRPLPRPDPPPDLRDTGQVPVGASHVVGDPTSPRSDRGSGPGCRPAGRGDGPYTLREPTCPAAPAR